MKALLFVSLLSLPTLASAANFPEIGEHLPVLTVEKNVNPQNVLVVYTKADEQCRFETNPANRDQPVFDFYWLMDRQNYKPVNGLIKREIAKRFVFQPPFTAQQFQIMVTDLKEMDTDIVNPTMDVYMGGQPGACTTHAEMNLGPSNGNVRIRLESIYTEGRSFPPAVYSVTLRGTEINSGKKISRKYLAK